MNPAYTLQPDNQKRDLVNKTQLLSQSVFGTEVERTACATVAIVTKPPFSLGISAPAAMPSHARCANCVACISSRAAPYARPAATDPAAHSSAGTRPSYSCRHDLRPAVALGALAATATLSLVAVALRARSLAASAATAAGRSRAPA